MTDSKKTAGTERKERLKSNLRANLQKRKSQARARTSPLTAEKDENQNTATGKHASHADKTEKN